jgi:hypothetical protein
MRAKFYSGNQDLNVGKKVKSVVLIKAYGEAEAYLCTFLSVAMNGMSY